MEFGDAYSPTKPPDPLIAGSEGDASNKLVAGHFESPARGTNEMPGRFGEVLWWLRTQRRFNQEVLAERAGIHHTQISVLERGGPRKSDFAPDFGHRLSPSCRPSPESDAPPRNPHVPETQPRTAGPARGLADADLRSTPGRLAAEQRSYEAPVGAEHQAGRGGARRVRDERRI